MRIKNPKRLLLRLPLSQPVFEGWTSTIRRNRWGYFLAQIALAGYTISMLLFLVIFGVLISGLSVAGLLVFIGGSAIYAVLFVISMLITVQRLRDINISGKWVVVLYSAAPILAALYHFDSGLDGIVIFLSLFQTVGFICLLILLFIPGTKGPNKYGPEPPDVYAHNPVNPKKAKS